MNELDHLHIELSGRHLIEASAGTGKTYAIACLYLRLLIEKDLLPEQILVVTYTEAATKELRHRIRSRIREALEVLGGTVSGDAFLLGLLSAAGADETSRQQAAERLKRALAMFDTASIFTIHSFCMRALQDHAFESGSLYDTELVTSQTELLREIVDDFWRSRFFAEPAPLLGYALQTKLSPDGLLAFLKGMLGPRLEILPRFTTEQIAAIEQRCCVAFTKVQEEWACSRSVVEDILLNSKELGRAADTYRVNDVVPALLAGLGTLVEGDNPYALFPGFDKCCLSAIIKATKKNKVPPEHPFFSCCEELLKGVQERFLALRWELIEFATERLPVLKRKANVRFFDDLLVDLSHALQGEGGDSCAASLGEKYPAALIDEFQDTDPHQYDIFRRIYAGSGKVLFLIGDPKQAIYSFRGADIFAYLEAASDVSDDKTHTLTGNWRSTPRLLAAFNTLFARRSAPFVFEEITYHPVNSGKTGDHDELVLTENDAPLQVWHLPLGDQNKPLTIGEATRRIPLAVAGEITRLLQAGREGKALLKGRPLSPGDMAVIVRTHREAKCIQEALRAQAVPSVMRSEQSIFVTDEAGQLYTLLHALADPGNESKVRAALVTPLLGRSGDDIARFLEDEQAWEEMLSHFRDYHHAWLERGFMVTFRWLLSRERVRGRLLQRPDGERRLTNVLHCLEVIHSAAHEKDLGIEGVLAWFGGRINAEENSEEHQIRLETDEQAVKIVTIHVSKGLEYPVVFCPFLWGGVRQGDDIISFHNGFTMGKDYGSPDYEKHQLQASREALAENLRLFYVALTRAKFRCYLIAGKVDGSRGASKPETSPLAYLLHSSTTDQADMVGELAAEVAGLSSAALLEDLRSLEGAAPGAIAVQEMPDEAADCWQPSFDPHSSFVCRNFNAVIGNDWRVASFTSFSRHDSVPGERPDRDEATAPYAVSSAAGDGVRGTSIFTFPKGAQAGIFLHSLFEELDFSGATAEIIKPQVEKGLDRYGYEQDWLEVVSAMVRNVIATPLAGPDGAFTLAGLHSGAWISELEFFFPLRFVTSDLLRNLLSRWNIASALEPDYLRSLNFKPVRGMVRGFMDMVFQHNGRYYLLDWKSNHLGYRVEDYGPAALREEMGRKLYTLQYQLYTVALNRYLALRVPGYDYASHFGGVIYLFLRGMSPEHGSQFGVFYDLPPVGLIDELSDLLVECE